MVIMDDWAALTVLPILLLLLPWQAAALLLLAVARARRVAAPDGHTEDAAEACDDVETTGRVRWVYVPLPALIVGRAPPMMMPDMDLVAGVRCVRPPGAAPTRLLRSPNRLGSRESAGVVTVDADGARLTFGEPPSLLPLPSAAAAVDEVDAMREALAVRVRAMRSLEAAAAAVPGGEEAPARAAEVLGEPLPLTCKRRAILDDERRMAGTAVSTSFPALAVDPPEGGRRSVGAELLRNARLPAASPPRVV